MEKTLVLGKIEGRRRREQQRMGWLDDTTDSMDMPYSLSAPGSLSSLGDIGRPADGRCGLLIHFWVNRIHGGKE